MSYLVAKKNDVNGCIAFEMKAGKRLAALNNYLTESTADNGIQIVTISRPEAYGEYAPYTIINDEVKFIESVLNMKDTSIRYAV